VHDGDPIERLPEAYAVAWRLRTSGAADDVIAVALGIEPAAVAGVLRVADAKLAELRARDARSAGETGGM
jgi:hypothetical protein